MIDLPALSAAIGILSSDAGPWMWVVPGLLLGLAAGAVPGCGAGIAMAIVLPFTYRMEFLEAIIFLTSIYTGGGFGSAIPAILINVPGGPSAVATAFDGHPMARKGQHNEALGLALSASAIATLVSYFVLLLFVQPMSTAVLALGPTEFLFVILWGITLIGALAGRSMGRGLVAGLIGILLGTIGISVLGDMRGTMGSVYLMDGIPAIPAMIALFAAREVLKPIDSTHLVDNSALRTLEFSKIIAGMVAVTRYPGPLIRGGIIGAVIGALPGVGAAIANLISYSETRRASPHPEVFGTGAPEGVVAAESANSSSEGGSMTTLLALGIPAGGATAIILGAFGIHNVTGGPRFFSEHKDIVYAIILSNMIQAVVLGLLGILVLRVVSMVVHVPTRFLMPAIVVAAVFGAYTITGSIVGPAAFAVFLAVGWIMYLYDFPVAAMVVGMLLGTGLEEEALRTWQLSGGDPAYLLERPVALVIAFLLIASMVAPALARRRKRASAAA